MTEQIFTGMHAAVCAVGAFAALWVLQARTASACLASPSGRRRWGARGLLALIAIGLFAEAAASAFGDAPPSAGEALTDLALTVGLVWGAGFRRCRRTTCARAARVARTASP